MAVHVDRRGDADHITVVTIDRPERRNALDQDTLSALVGAVTEVPAGTRALVLTGAAGHFCSGADLSGVEDQHIADSLQAVLVALHHAPFPTIAAVEGAALGAGTQLAVACDLRTAHPDASFGIPAAKLGLMVNHWTVQRLVALAGEGTARSMLLAAEVMSGSDAHRIGLVQRLGGVEDGLLWADDITTKAPLTIAGHKVMLNALTPDPVPDEAVEAAFSRAWQSDDFAEGLAAFRERRTPNFHGR